MASAAATKRRGPDDVPALQTAEWQSGRHPGAGATGAVVGFPSQVNARVSKRISGLELARHSVGSVRHVSGGNFTPSSARKPTTPLSIENRTQCRRRQGPRALQFVTSRQRVRR